ncbi:Hsp20/alpha crystallin family protein [Candidatus Falkowbacteria bacterium]|nr:Hsp20/alpha crystallin family protein [Candidatus Falkowbacteria bacterium]
MDMREFFITPQGFTDTDLQQLEAKTKADWYSEDAEGQLAVDVFQTDKAIVVKTAIAGVEPKDIKISIHNEVLTIQGTRNREETVTDEDYYYRECYWGKFSRSVILPVEIKQDSIDAVFKNGVLTITLPKAKPEKMVKIKIEE